jgi:transcriptional regulator with XRE-family HTH domain
MNLGHTIKNMRILSGLKQNQLAKNCNLSQTYISQIEHNQKEPNLSTLKIIAEQLKMPLPLLFWLSLSEEDVSEEKRAMFKLIKPAINSLIKEFFGDFAKNSRG